MSEESKVSLTAIFMLFVLFMSIIYGGINSDNNEHELKLAKLKIPVIECYKQTMNDHTGVLHRIKCPSKEGL